MAWKRALAGFLAPALAAAAPALAEGDSEAAARAAFGQMREMAPDSPVRERLACTAIVAGADGHARFETRWLPFHEIDASSFGDVEMASSPPYRPRFLSIVSLPPGARADWHPAPQPTLNFVLAGELEVEVRGERRRFGPGSVVIGDDSGSEGHRTGSVGDENLLMAVAPLAADSE